MADKTTTSQAGAAPTADSPAAIRNVVLVGPSGGGKTTLVEALLVAAGVLNRPGSVVDGTTVCDCDEAEISQQRSVGLALASLQHDGVKVNLIDTPGYADFVGELRAGLRAADCALFVIAANEEIDQPTKSLWLECSQVGMPRAVLVTKLDHARANYDNALTPRSRHSATRCCRCTCPPTLPAPASSVCSRRPTSNTPTASAPHLTNPTRSYGDAIDRDARQPDRGNHRGVRGRDTDGALPRRRGDRPVGADRRSREGRRARVVLSGDPRVQHHRRRHPRTAGGHHRRLPVPARAPAPRGVHPAGQVPQQPAV